MATVATTARAISRLVVAVLKLITRRVDSTRHCERPGSPRAARHAHGGPRASRTLIMAIVVLSVVGARAALPKHAHIDAQYMVALRDGADICGDAAHSTSCLKLVPCAEVDNELDCSACYPSRAPRGLWAAISRRFSPSCVIRSATST